MLLPFQWVLKSLLVISVTIASFAQLGCASGGFQLTRKYARFVNGQNLILRIVIYLLTGIVFAVTLLIDMVIFNTMDFWNGRVSASDYKFEKDGKIFLVSHSYKGKDKNLRNTEIQIFSANHYQVGQAEKTIEISELESGKIQLKEDGVVKKTLDSLEGLQIDKAAEDKYLKGSGYSLASAL